MKSPLFAQSKELTAVWRSRARAIVRNQRWRSLRGHLRTLRRNLLHPGTARGDEREVVFDPRFPEGFACFHHLERCVLETVPWRLGPYRIGQLEIDSEWISWRKWNQIRPHLPAIGGKRILDIGCSNGYFSIRAAIEGAAEVIAVDPIDRCWMQWKLLKHMGEIPAVHFLPLKWEEVDLISGEFDLILCMGVIYHQRDPVQSLRLLTKKLAPHGRLFLESLAIPSDKDEVLIPQERYAKMRNAWQIPSPSALARWAREAGFENATPVVAEPISCDEQRRTPHAPYESLADFLDPDDQSKTIEGYPAPIRAAITASFR